MCRERGERGQWVLLPLKGGPRVSLQWKGAPRV